MASGYQDAVRQLEGKPVPSIEHGLFLVKPQSSKEEEGPQPGVPTTSLDLWGSNSGNKKCVIIGIPGAYTPVCSSQHLPGFLEKAAEFNQRGVKLFCVAVNDPFVMSAFAQNLYANKSSKEKQQQQGAQSEQQTHQLIQFVSDGNGAWTRAIGLQLDMQDKGLGTRSKRYVMVVVDGVVRKVCLEEQPNDLKITDAGHVLEACSTLLA